MTANLFPFSRLRRAALSALLVLLGLSHAIAAELKTKNVVLITADGLRWQEVFRGAEDLLMTKQHGGVKETNELRREFWRSTPEERRAALLPFFWSEIARKGQLWGNFDRGSVVRVTNGKNFSFPGYNEILCGYGDPRITSNDKKPNANTNILEWLHHQPSFHGKVAAFGCWDVFPFILNRDRAKFPVQAGWEIVDQPHPKRDDLNRVLRETPRYWNNVIYDSFMFHTALDYLREHQPRVIYLAFGETDDWAHDGRYDMYLHAARGFDRSVQFLWNTLQSLPNYRDQTTLVIATDHGRGTGRADWKDHGERLPDSALIWIAALGPDTRALGEVQRTKELTQGQIAATVAALLGQNFPAQNPKAAPPIRQIFEAGQRD
jgi:hypothetical protein